MCRRSPSGWSLGPYSHSSILESAFRRACPGGSTTDQLPNNLCQIASIQVSHKLSAGPVPAGVTIFQSADPPEIWVHRAPAGTSPAETSPNRTLIHRAILSAIPENCAVWTDAIEADPRLQRFLTLILLLILIPIRPAIFSRLEQLAERLHRAKPLTNGDHNRIKIRSTITRGIR